MAIVLGTFGASWMCPVYAFANDIEWGLGETAEEIGIGREAGNAASAGTISSVISAVVNVFAGIAVSLCVIKLVLTAINKVIFYNGGETGTPAVTQQGRPGKGRQGAELNDSPFDLTELPGFIAAYPPTLSWREIFTKVLMALAIILGIWVLMGVLLGFLNWTITVMTNGNANNACVATTPIA